MRVFNFAAGPAALPLEVLEQLRDELLDWRGQGASVMEVSHRSAAFVAVVEEAEALLRELLTIPGSHRVLFFQGGATGQFAAVPLNLAAAGDSADYLNTGTWSKKAILEAQRLLARVNVLADEAASRYTTVPDPAAITVTPGAAYLHYTPNETIGGVEFPYVPEPKSVPLVADFSSSILSRPLDVARFGLIYAGAQKNLGPAGLALVIVHEGLLKGARAGTPSVLDYRAMAAEKSLLNTPPTFALYVSLLTLRWLKAQGGLGTIGARNRAKAELLYRTIDASWFYGNPVAPHCRSWMNVPFTVARSELEPLFLAEAREAGLANLEGHRSVGGMRASLYNAMPLEGVAALVGFMREFERRHG